MNRRFICSAFAALAAAALTAGCAKAPVATSATTPSTPGTQRAAVAVAAGESPTSPRQGMSTAAPTSGSVAPGSAVTSRPAPSEFSVVADLRDIHFAFDKYDIRPQAAEILGMNGRWLRAHPNYAVLIEGHCDERGTNEYNLALGERRAKASMNYLVSLGIAATRIAMVSYGEERPACNDKTEACWSTNRRARFLVRPM